MKSLVLHDATRRQLQNFVAEPTHALLLVAPTGMGKATLASHLAAQLLKLETEQLASYPYKMFLRLTGGSISIDAIRQLRTFLRLKTTGKPAVRRVIVIEQTDTLTLEAQNAFLKILEEPPSDTVIILTAANPKVLLRTIISRTQVLTVKTPPEQQLRSSLGSNTDREFADRAYLLSGGLPGLFSALLNDEAEHPLVSSMAEVKSLLAMPTFDRLVAADLLSRDRDACLSLVEALERAARAGMQVAGTSRDHKHMQQWHRIRKAVHQAQQALLHNANAKLTLTDLMLQL